MSRVRSFFLREAGECLADLGTELNGNPMDVSAVYRAIRRLRGSAQMARFDGIARAAGGLEQRLRPYVVGGRSGSGGSGPDRPAAYPEESLRREVREILIGLRADVEAVREGRLEADPRMEAGMDEQDDQKEQEERGGDVVEVVPIATLEYRGEAALERALDLRPTIEDAVASGASAGAVLDELFDLIRLGAK